MGQYHGVLFLKRYLEKDCEEVPSEKVLRKLRKYLQKAFSRHGEEHVPSLDMGVCPVQKHFGASGTWNGIKEVGTEGST